MPKHLLLYITLPQDGCLQDAATANTSSRSSVLKAFSASLEKGSTLTRPVVERYQQLQCSKGYSGNLCSKCAEPGYGTASSGDKCSICPSKQLNNLYFFLSSLISVAAIAVTVRAQLKNLRDKYSEPDGQEQGAAAQAGTEAKEPGKSYSIVIKASSRLELQACLAPTCMCSPRMPQCCLRARNLGLASSLACMRMGPACQCDG